MNVYATELETGLEGCGDKKLESTACLPANVMHIKSFSDVLDWKENGGWIEMRVFW